MNIFRVNYFNAILKIVISNEKSKKRRDQMITIFFRKIKKLALELVKLCATTNLYKRTKILDYTKSFIEAYNAFSVCVNDNTENTPFDEIQGFIEFIVIFFPQQKVEAIIQSLQISKEVDLSMLDDQLHFLRERNKTTKRFIEIWTKKS